MRKNLFKILSFLFFLIPFSVLANTSVNIDELLEQCATNIPKPIGHAIISTESAYNPNAIGVNFKGKSVSGFKQPNNYNDAVLIATNLINSGKNIDLGYAQINSSNLKMLNLSVSQVLNPCTNMKAMQYIFAKCFNSAKGSYSLRIQKSFSCYNTGNYERGFKNGYVKKAVKNLNSFFVKNGKNNNISDNISDNINYTVLENTINDDIISDNNGNFSKVNNINNEDEKHQNSFDVFVVSNQKGLF